jgi:Tol biopolymer transport system component
MTAILKDDPPDLPSHERNIPPALARIVDRCLEKQPTARFQSAGDLAFALEALTSGTSSTAARVPALDVDPRPTRAIRGVVSAAIAVFAIAIVATAVWIAAARARSERPGPVVSFTFEPSDGWTFAASGWAGTGISNAPLAVAPDGSRIAFVARNAAGSPALWVRRLDTVAAQMLPGTDGAASPFWSPDSRFVGFFADGKLKKVDLTGAPPATVADVPNGVDGSWGRDNVIVFAVISGEVTPLQRVSASGGIPTAGTTVLPGETKHVRPLFLPDGRHLLFRMGTANRGPIFLTALDSTERRRLVDAESTNVAFSSDHLLFLRDRTLMAQRFPESTWMLDGEPFPVAESIATTPSSSTVFAHFAASPSGVLVYQVGPPAVPPRLQWVDRSGKASAVAGEPGAYGDLELSPDGGRALVSVSDSGHGTRDVWIFDLKRGVRSRFTFDPSEDQTSVWSPDGETVVFNSRRSDRADLYIKPANGSTAEQLLLSDATDKVPTSWSPDGRFLMFMKVSATTSDLWVLPMTGERKPMPFLDSKFNESAGRFSPDGQWVAYTSNESGRPEVYVTSFPRPGGRWQISTGSGVQPRWRSDGTELIYRDLATNRLIAAAVRPERSGFTVAQVTPLFVTRPGGPRSFFDLSPDGQTILVNAPGPDAANPQPSPLTVVVNWAAALKR